MSCIKRIPTYFLVLLLTCICSLIINGQTDTIKLSEQDEEDRIITQQLQWYLDEENEYDFDSLDYLSTSLINTFTVTADTLTMPLEQKLWYRFQICNETTDTMIRFFYAHWGIHFEIRIENEQGQFNYEKSGDLVNYYDCSVPDYNRYLAIMLPPKSCNKVIGSWECWDKEFLKDSIDNNYFALRTRKSMEEFQILHYRGQTYYQGEVIFIGILGFLGLFMFLQYKQVKDKIYLLYANYIGALFIYYLFRRTYYFPFPFRYVAEWAYEMEPYIALLPILFYIYFFRFFLDITIDSYPTMHWYSKFAEYFIISIWFLFPIIHLLYSIKVATLFFIWGRYLFVFLFIPIIIKIFSRAREGDSFAQYFFYRTLVLLVGVFINISIDLIDKVGWWTREELLFPYLGYSQLGILCENAIFALALGYRSFIKEQERQRVKLELELAKDDLDRATLNPHMLNTALANILQDFNNSNNKHGIKYLEILNDLQSQILRSLKQPMWLLTEEIKLTERYIKLGALRFSPSRNFQYELIVANSLQTDEIVIPTMLFQPIVENALNHGLFDQIEQSPILRVEIRKSPNKEGVEILIEDNGIGRKAAKTKGIYRKKTTHIGLSLTKQRLQRFHTNATINILDLQTLEDSLSGTLVTIFIPLK